MVEMSLKAIKPSLKNPFAPTETVEFTIPGEIEHNERKAG
jgi:hypothetical protein